LSQMSERVPDGIDWLDRGEAETWRTFLDANRALFSALESQLNADSQMPLAYYEILVTLSEAPERTLRMGTLATSTRSSSSRLSHAVARLEKCGWVSRQSHPSDRRGQVAALTDKGAEALAAASPGHVRAVRQYLIDALTPEQRVALTDISRAICAATTAHTTETPAPHPHEG